MMPIGTEMIAAAAVIEQGADDRVQRAAAGADDAAHVGA